VFQRAVYNALTASLDSSHAQTLGTGCVFGGSLPSPPPPHQPSFRQKSRILDCEDAGFSNARRGRDNRLLLLHDNGGYTVELVHPARYQENINDEQDAQNYKRNYPD